MNMFFHVVDIQLRYFVQHCETSSSILLAIYFLGTFIFMNVAYVATYKAILHILTNCTKPGLCTEI